MKKLNQRATAFRQKNEHVVVQKLDVYFNNVDSQYPNTVQPIK